ncbi:MAG: hypothetical protein IIZ83_08865 [Oscillospiraceae bacterium]|nr:hypothetical protein [Oscillospiraceae bacterium]
MSWRSEARAALRQYPKLKRRQGENEATITPVYGGAAVQHSASRTTEDVALRSTLTEREENIISAVEFMLSMQRRYANSNERLRMVELVYFKHTHTIDGAADVVHYSPDALWRWNGEILTAVYVGLKKK